MSDGKTYPVFHAGKLREMTEDQMEMARRNRMLPEERNAEDIEALQNEVAYLKQQLHSLIEAASLHNAMWQEHLLNGHT